MSEPTIVHHLECWPLVVSKIFGEDHSEETLRDAYSLWTEVNHRGPHVVIVDMTEGNAAATAAQRARVAEWLEANDELLRKGRQVANVLVFDSAVVRGIVTAVFWLRKPITPHYAASDMEKAVDYAVARLREAGVPIGAEQIAAARRVGSRPRGRA